METPRPRRVKNCPNCLLMTVSGTTHCTNCGHLFSTGLADAEVSSYKLLETAELHRTQMFTMPPVVTRPPAALDDARPADEQFTAMEKAWMARRRLARGAYYAAFVLIALMACALLWAATRF